MARLKISEYHAKKLLLPSYRGLTATSVTTAKEIKDFFPSDNLVLKLDQGIKKRGQQGLVKLNLTPSQIPPILKQWSRLGWSNFLIEPVVEHAASAEHYLALERMRDGWQLSYSDHGGVEVENSWDLVKRTVLRSKGQALRSEGQALTGDMANGQVGMPKAEGLALQAYILQIIPLLDANHISFLEMNPVLLRAHQLIPLDIACEVDSAGSSLATIPDRNQGASEKSIAALDATTPASLKFKLLNPNGSIWVLLSGGGASLVLADELADQGIGKDLANYGEYSGAPKDDDVYSYTKIILSQLLKSNVSHLKSIIVAGGVANFTDVKKTFSGIIRALDEKQQELRLAKAKIFVRRGGPNEAAGLQMMKDFLKQSGLLGSIHGHETPLTQVVSEVRDYLGSDLKGSAQPRDILSAEGQTLKDKSI